jgi:hypothetical protein
MELTAAQLVERTGSGLAQVTRVFRPRRQAGRSRMFRLPLCPHDQMCNSFSGSSTLCRPH